MAQFNTFYIPMDDDIPMAERHAGLLKRTKGFDEKCRVPDGENVAEMRTDFVDYAEMPVNNVFPDFRTVDFGDNAPGKGELVECPRHADDAQRPSGCFIAARCKSAVHESAYVHVSSI